MKNKTIGPLAGPQVRFRYDVICDLNKTKYATGPPHCKESCEWLITIERLILSQLSDDLCINCSFLSLLLYSACTYLSLFILKSFKRSLGKNIYLDELSTATLQSSTGRLK